MYTLDHSLLHMLHRASQAASDKFSIEQGSSGLTPRQLVVLAAISENEGLSQTKIVDRTGIDRSTLTDVVRRLQRSGLLARKRTRDDARTYAVRITAEGRKALRDAGEVAERIETRIMASLPSRERNEFLRLLDSVTKPPARLNRQA